MSYLLKLQTSPTVVLESFLNNTKSGTDYYYCRNCFRCHPFFRHKVQGLSTYASALKVTPLKKRVLKKPENDSVSRKTIDLQKLTKMVKLSSNTTCKTKTEDNFDFYSLKEPSKTNLRIDSTNSYDPNLMVYNLDVEKFLKDPCEKNDLDNLPMKFDKANKQPRIKRKKDINLSQKNLKIDKNSLFSLLNVNKLNHLPSLKEPVPNSFSIKKKSIDFEKFCVDLNKDDEVIQFLHSCADICSVNGKITEAFKLFKMYREKSIWKYLDYKSERLIDAYNTLLYGLADNGHWHLMQEVINWMHLDNIKLNCDSFAALFLCLGKIKIYENERIIKNEIMSVVDQLFVNNISLNDIFYKTILTKEKSESILGVIQDVVPFFEIDPITVKLSSNCSLLENVHMGNSNLQSPVDNLKIETLENLIEEQLLMEKKFYIKVKAVSGISPGECSHKHKLKLEKLKMEWRDSLTKAIVKARDLEEIKDLGVSKMNNFHLHLSTLPVQELVDILMDLTVFLAESSLGFSQNTAYICKMIGTRVSYCYQDKKKRDIGLIEKTERLLKQNAFWYLDPSGPARNSRQNWQMLIQDSEGTNQLDCPVVKWPDEVINNVGRYLLHIVLNEVKHTPEGGNKTKSFPVFYIVLRHRKNAWHEEIKCHPLVKSLFEKVGFDTLSFRANEMPMVCPPKPWKTTSHGGYLFLSTDFIRRSSHIQGKAVNFKNVPAEQMYATFDSLNALQAVPWMINEDVLDVALEVFKNGGSEKLNVPHFPERIRNENAISQSMSFQERMKINADMKEKSKKRMNAYALWCEALYRLSLANHFRKKLFWLPQNCDFRGRVYPVPSLLNHLGADLFRSLLMFGKGKPLGPKGLDWIKIHLINLMGTHKRKTVEERLAHANEVMPYILDSAQNPLTGKKWWTESDEPWQTLATCFEISKIVSSSSPEHYVCRLPVHQDGSCNGLQHYAALGKDQIGAESVNLAAIGKPQDVYTVVADLIEQERLKDAENGVEIALVLNGFIERKVVKQTVMTTVYGVTPFGAKLQIAKRLEEIPDFPKNYITPAAAYLSEKTFECLKKMFTSAKLIQDWFIQSAKVICASNDYVQWVSPLGLPVLQSYGKYRINREERRKIIVPNSLKQRNAFPPNFIHSLDSSHMMLTALYCEQAGLTFASIHDCFWTHPSTVDLMNKICREQFVSLHSQPILEDLSHFFIQQYLPSDLINTEASTIFKSVPGKGAFDLKEVLNSVYFFS